MLLIIILILSLDSNIIIIIIVIIIINKFIIKIKQLTIYLPLILNVKLLLV